MVIFVFAILWVGGIGRTWVQKITRIKLMKFTRFYCLFIVEKMRLSNKIFEISIFNFNSQFLCTVFWAKTVPIPLSYILLNGYIILLVNQFNTDIINSLSGILLTALLNNTSFENWEKIFHNESISCVAIKYRKSNLCNFML